MELSNPEVPLGQRNREREKRCAVLVGYIAEEYVLCQSRNLIAGSDWKYNFHFLCSSYKFKVSDKAEGERTCVAVCRQEIS